MCPFPIRHGRLVRRERETKNRNHLSGLLNVIFFGCYSESMNNEQGALDKSKLFLRPADKSLEAYKNFVKSMVCHLNRGQTLDEDDMTEAEWEADWKEFWNKHPD
jgi:hypothetical protein